MFPWLRKRPKYENVKIVSDLDALVQDPVGFVFNGRTYVVKPMTTEQFSKVVLILAEIDQLRAKFAAQGGEWDEAKRKYQRLFDVAVDGLTASDYSKMEKPQTIALFQIILRCVGGEAQVDQEKKSPPAQTKAR